MSNKLCQTCLTKKAMIVRPKTQKLTCLDCFYVAVEEEVHYTITSNDLFKPGEKIALGASGGKDSTGTFLISSDCSFDALFKHEIQLWARTFPSIY